MSQRIEVYLETEDIMGKLTTVEMKFFKPRGKESTEVRKSQIKGKESENSYQ